MPKAVSGPGIDKHNPRSFALTLPMQDSMKIIYLRIRCSDIIELGIGGSGAYAHRLPSSNGCKNILAESTRGESFPHGLCYSARFNAVACIQNLRHYTLQFLHQLFIRG